MKDTVVIMKSL